MQLGLVDGQDVPEWLALRNHGDGRGDGDADQPAKGFGAARGRCQANGFGVHGRSPGVVRFSHHQHSSCQNRIR
jgi:hypothetical protein